MAGARASGVGLLEAQNGCARLVFLAERQIGAELAKGTKTGDVAPQGRPRKTSTAAKFSELGLTGDQSAAYQQLAEVPPDVIDKVVAQANAEQRHACGRRIVAPI
jgi:hypothetical protein